MNHRDERGLALLLVISLMALVTLIVVSLSVITRIETSVGAAQSEQTRARANAMAGLQVALARLQEAVGPDRRTTATAEATGNDVNPHWVGVWRTDQAGTAVESWLVSGTAPDPGQVEGVQRDRVIMVADDEDEEREVMAPLEILRETSDGESARGAFAYFVADQGLKATLQAPIATPADDDIFSQRRILSGGSRAEGFGDVTEVNAASVSFLDGLSSAMSSEQWQLLVPEDAVEVVRERWHDYAGWNRGLLANSIDGGLKRDLTLLGATEISGLGSYLDLASTDRENALSPVYPMRAATNASGSGIYDGIHPIVTQLGIQFSVHTISATSRTLETRLRFFVELANPFTGSFEPEDLRLVVSGIPREIDIEARTSGSTSDHGVSSVNLESLYALHQDPDGRPAMEFDLPLAAARWEPGRVYSWRLQSGNTMGETANRELVFDASTRTSYWRERPGAVLDGPDALVGSSELRFTGTDDWVIRYWLQRLDGEVLVQGELPEFFAVESAWQDANSTLPDFGIEARLVDRNEAQDAEGRSAWLEGDSAEGFLSNDYSEQLWAPKIDLESASYNVAFSGPNSGVEARQLFNRDPVDRNYLSYYQASYNSDVALFELPRSPVLSIGALQHLPFADGPVYNVGNSWSEQNDWFDRYYLGGRSPGALEDSTIMNPALDRIEPNIALRDDERSAQDWWVRGAFNINSVRPAAWAALLRGVGGGAAGTPLVHTTHDAASGDVTGEAVVSSVRPLGRFSQSASDMWEISPNETNFQAVLRTYRQGLRSLSESQIQSLAVLIAEGVQERITAVGPYRSLEEFLAGDTARFGGANVIEHAIETHDLAVVPSERINWDNYFPNDPIPIDVAAPMFLTSADIMTALGSSLSARSDTFLIRAYGESVPETIIANYGETEPVAEAWVEALVQRFPEGVDPSDFNQGSDDDWSSEVADPNLGRRFRVIALRWLTEEDL